ncbi:hypothetical protein [Micromonospora echinofusca]|uniref:Integral membrane protein n=1 Tax=Micromonospora echinofusca TaxID=47858 RepID=A0ABS3VVZ0_MICEH|nr:hypothetical protein [Micromonospora echinofusca]MBO4208631.1 hypothetical protein [Micromonospora echinofusca]
MTASNRGTRRAGPPPADQSSGLSPLIAVPARAVALLVVVPVRLAWAAVMAVGGAVDRYLLRPVGRFLHRYLLRPVGWFLHRVVWLPLAWLFRHLLWVPAVWLLRYLVWIPLTWVVRYLIWVPLDRLARLLAPLGPVLARWFDACWRVLADAVGYAWRAAGWLLRGIHRILFRPVGIVLAGVWRYTVVPVARGVRAVWRATVVPVARWVDRAVLGPVRAATREVLAALGLRG